MSSLANFLDEPGSRAFLKVWAGLTVSLIGSGLTSFALGVWIFQQTSSTTQYALVIFCATAPPLLLLPLVGPIIDRFHRKRLLIVCDIAGALGTCAVGLFAWMGTLSLLHACIIVIVISSASALQWPTYAATVTLLVPRDQLGRASGMTQLAQAVSQVAAPLIAGGLMAVIGLAGIAFIDLATFVVSTVMLLLAAIPRTPASTRPRRSYWRNVAFGWTYIFGRAGLAALLLMFATVNFFSEMASVLFTPFVLSFSTAAALGTIVAVGGVGLLLGGAVMAVWGGSKQPARGAVLFAALGGIAVTFTGFTTSILWLSVIAAAFFFCLPIMAGSSQVVWQRTVPVDIQGRVFAMRTAIAMAAVPLASLIAGPLADQVFEPGLAAGGRWASSVGSIFGVGPGRGIAVILVISGVLSVLTAAVALLYRPLRDLDTEAPPEGAPPESTGTPPGLPDAGAGDVAPDAPPTATHTTHTTHSTTLSNES